MSRIRIIHTYKESFCVNEGNLCKNNNIQEKCMKCFVYTGHTKVGEKTILFNAGEKFDDNGRQQGKKTHKRT